MSKSETSPTADLLRQLLRDTGQSVNALAHAAGVAQPVLHRFIAGEQGLTLRNADRLIAFFELELTQRKQRGGGKGSKKPAGRCAANTPPA